MPEPAQIPKHSKKDIEKVLKDMRAAAWTAEDPFGHGFRVMCPFGCCKRAVASTPRNPTNAAKRLRQGFNKCSGGTDG